jgi:hypothetical protein
VTNKGFRVVVYQEGDRWIAQMLEHDIRAQGPDLSTVHKRLMATLQAEIAESISKGRLPLEGIDPAPPRFEEYWAKRSSFTEQDQVADNVPVCLAIAA